jgi:hypothetical protein
MTTEDNTKAKITFDVTKVVDDENKGTPQEIRFEEGKTYELSLRSADRWVKRGVAHFASDEDAAKARGASSDVALNLQDRDRVDPNASRTQPEGTGEAKKPGGDGGGDDDGDDLHKKTVADLKTIAAERKVDIGGLTKKDDIIAAIERDGAIKESLAAGRFDDLTVAELQKVAADQEIDLTGKTAKPDVVEAVKAGYKQPAAA